jgi:hypothetical protein
MKYTTSIVRNTRITVGGLLLWAGLAVGVERPTVDLAINHGPILHNGNGFHGSLSHNVDLDRVMPLRPAVLRRYGNQTLAVASRTGAEVVCLLPNYNEGENWQNNWGAWESKVRSRVNDMKNARQQHGISYHYDIWNEPDNWQVPNYNEFWCKTAVLIRELDSNARIAGPSYSYAGGLREFFEYTHSYSQQHGVNARPDILNWHEFSDPMKIVDDATGTRQWLADNGYDQYVTQLSVNELMMSPMPDDIPRMFAATEIADLAWAGCGYGYRGPDQLNGLLKDDGETPNGAWHAYKFYADTDGEVVGVEHSENVNVFAAFDEDQQEIRVLLGTDKNRDEDVNVVIRNLSATGLFASSGVVRVTTERYKIWGGIDNEHEFEIAYNGDVLELPLAQLVSGEDLLPGTDKHGMGLVISYVPEPSALAVLAVGVPALIRRRRRHR